MSPFFIAANNQHSLAQKIPFVFLIYFAVLIAAFLWDSYGSKKLLEKTSKATGYVTFFSILAASILAVL